MINIPQILHRVSNQLLDANEETQIYQIMYDGVSEILPDMYFLISKIEPDDMNFRIIHSYGFDTYFSIIKTLLGKDPYTMDFPFSGMDQATQESFENRTLYHFPEGLHGLSCGKVNKTVCQTIEKILGISDVYSVSLCIGKNYFGSANFFITRTNKNDEDLPQDIIYALESIANLTSFAINRFRDFDKLHRKDKELLITQSRFTQIINKLDVVVWQANGDGSEFQDLNNCFGKICGNSPSVIANNTNLWYDIIHKEDKEIYDKSILDLIKNGNVDCDYRIIKINGSVVWIKDRKSIIMDDNGNPIQMGGIISDITAIKELESNLRQSESTLSNLNKQKDKFFTIISHDLKSPCNNVIGLLEVITDGYADYDDEQRFTIIKATNESAQKAFLLLSDLLEWARLQNSNAIIDKEIVNLHKIILETIDLNQNNLVAKGISINNNIADNVLLNVDLNSISTIIRNIFTNAIKFTNNGGNIELNLNQLNDYIEFSIKDTGVGMSEETIDKLFKLGENKTKVGTNNETGTGLGLLICNEIITKNNWKIDVESKLGNGSTFKISIPLN